MIPHFDSKKAELDWLRQNKALLLHQKKAAIKYTDAIPLITPRIFSTLADTLQGKAALTEENTSGILKAEAVMNSCNFLDSHGDVHLNGIWKKTIKDAGTKGFYWLQEHQSKFDKVIAEGAKAEVRTVTWKSLGYDYPGTTEALVFLADLEPERNPYMHEQYAKGRVKEHSVGMYYDQIAMCVNSEEKWWREEKENWEEFAPLVANKEALEGRSAFWAVKAARLVEGSAVLMGSNPATPTISVSPAAAKRLDQPRSNRFQTIGKKY